MTVIDVIAGMTGAVRRCQKEGCDWGRADHESGTTVIRIFSVRNLVEFILRHGDIDNRTVGQIKEAMQQGGRYTGKSRDSKGGEYRAERSR